MTEEWRAEITAFEKHGGVLSKRIWLDNNGKVVSDGSACVMTRGTARRVQISDIRAYQDVVNSCSPTEALALGKLRDGLPAKVRVVTADKLNGANDPATIARTKDFLIFERDEGGLVLLDFDPKGMSEVVAQQFNECGGLFGALCTVLPALETVALAERQSTSSGLRNAETGETFPHSGGKHLVIPLLNAADIPRFLSDLHDRCWLCGFGWGIVSAAGSFLERSIVDKSCGSPERLIFEGAPIVEPPLVQAAREVIAHEGSILDTMLCAPLTDSEREALQKLVSAEKHRLLPERQAARSAWSVNHIERLISRGIPETEARAQVDRWIDHHELTDAFELPFDKRELAGTTVADVFANPERFVNETMADPLEGPAYGRGKAILYRRANGSLFVNSFAHGGMTYELTANQKTANESVFDPWERYIVPDFPVHVLPQMVQDYVTSQAMVIGCDPSALAMAALTAFSGALDHRFAVKMMRNGNWWEHPRLWTLLVGDPSRKKTPIINDVTRPLERHQNDLRRDYEARLRDYEAAKKNENDDAKKPDPPVRYVVWDTTTEKLGEILSRSEHGLLVKRDEFSGWIGGMEKYSSSRGAGADRGFWLQAFDGGPHAVDRIGRGETYIPNLSVSLIGGIQPAKLIEMHGLTSDGLLQRFLPVMIRSSGLARDCESNDEENYQRLIYKLIAARHQRLFLSDEALALMNDIRAHLHELEQAVGGLADGLQAFVGKLAGIAGRLAVILHMAANPENAPWEIQGATVVNVRTLIVDFILPHALEFYRSTEELTNGERLSVG